MHEKATEMKRKKRLIEKKDLKKRQYFQSCLATVLKEGWR